MNTCTLTQIIGTPVIVPTRVDSIMSAGMEDDWSNSLAMGSTVNQSTDRLAEFHRLREFGLNIVLHIAFSYSMFGQRADDALRTQHADAVDGFNFNGSMASFVRLADLGNLADKPCWHGNEVDLGILEAGYLHAAAASPACSWPSDIFGRLVREHDLLREPFGFDGKYAVVPIGPGLGVPRRDSDGALSGWGGC